VSQHVVHFLGDPGPLAQPGLVGTQLALGLGPCPVPQEVAWGGGRGQRDEGFVCAAGAVVVQINLAFSEGGDAWFSSRIPTADVRHSGRRPAAAEVNVHENGMHPAWQAWL
jgi:hypothetical protein